MLRFTKMLFSTALCLLLTSTPSLFSFAQSASNNECGNAIVLLQNTVCTQSSGTTIGSTISSGAAATCEENNTGDVWYSFTATDDSAVVSVKDIVATNANAAIYSFGIAAYSGSCGTLTQIACNSNGHNSINTSILVGSATLEMLLTNLTIGQTVYLKFWKTVALNNSVDIVSNNLNFNICVSKVPAPPDCTILISPLNAATNVTIFPVVPISLKWHSVTGATSYRLYIDTLLTSSYDFNTITVYDTIATINNALQFGKTYYWYVTPLNAGGTPIGCTPDVSTFTTQSAPLAPANDLCTGAIALTSGVIGLNQAATDDYSSLPLCG